MVSSSEFYSEEYDSIVQKICKPYSTFLDAGVGSLGETTNSICDLGIGTGNFSLAVRRRFPNVRVYGRDLNPDFVNISKTRLGNNAENIECLNVFSLPFPEVDACVSSLMMHHVNKLSYFIFPMLFSKQFVNFDFALFGGKNKGNLIDEVLKFARRSFNKKEDLEKIAQEISEKDHPFSLDSQIDLFYSRGYRVSILKKEFPYVVYSVVER